MNDQEKREIESRVVTITPARCKEMLQKNSHNRPLRKATVSQYARQMEAREWVVNGESIIISNGGDVLDGQHRLHACIEADVPFTSMVVFGVDIDAFKTLNTGATRSGTDMLCIAGYDKFVASTCSAAAKSCILFERFGHATGSGHSNHLTTSGKKMDWVVCHPRIKEIALAIQKYGMTNRIVSASIIVFLWYYMEMIDKDKTEEFWHGVLTMSNLTENDTRLALANRFRLISGSTKKYSTRAKVGFCIKAWDWFRKGKTTKYHSNIFRDAEEAISILNTKETRPDYN